MDGPRTAPDYAVSDAMRAYAATAMDYAEARFDITLDYSERSLEDVDRILAVWMRSGLVDPERLCEEERQGLWTFCKTMGGYVGEVVIRNIGGSWRAEPLREDAVAALLVTDAGAHASPPDAVWRTLTEPLKSVASYYRALKSVGKAKR
ncbi:MAG: hypothetical protein HY928_16165 [Elusimicrobia bacterium]|nr:hypothetical protein [Elusimicrobiota bacterium]